MATSLTFTGQAREAMAGSGKDPMKAIPPGQMVAREGPTPKPEQAQQLDYGPNNEFLEEGRKDPQTGAPLLPGKPEVVAALRSLVLEYRMEGIVGRRHEIRRIKKNRLFWQMQQYSTGWDADQQDWQMPTGATTGLRTEEDDESEAGGRYQYVTPLYIGFGDGFISVFASQAPTIHWYPQHAQKEEDIATAKAASEVEDLIAEQNRVDKLLQKIGLCLWTDGKLGAFVRYVADGRQYGFHENPIVQAQPQKFGDDVYRCPSCGTETPEGQLYSGMVCPQCGTQMGPEDFQEAPLIPVPVVTGYEKVPNGQVVISIVGGLEYNTPVWANEDHEMPYRQWQLEVHEAKLRATYPEAADKIKPGNPNDADDVYARASRVAIQQGLPTTHPGDALTSLVTYTRNWIEPWAFASDKIRPDVRKDLLALFPDGCYCAFAGETYCESRNEAGMDHWKTLHAREGDGQNRLAVGDVIIPVQERYNTWSNIVTENIEYGIPPVAADPSVVDFDAISQREVQPSSWIPIKAAVRGQPLANSFHQLNPSAIPVETLPYMEAMFGPIPEMLTGLVPALWGGDVQGAGGKTLGGYQIAVEKAMGRLGLFYRRFKAFWADVMTLALRCFQENVTEDVQRTVLGEDGEYEQKVISIADLRGKAQARPEADETYPAQKSQQRGVIMNLLGAPELAAMFNEPANLREIKSVLGLTDFVIPGEDSANKQLREIQMLLQSAPIQTAPGPAGPDGQPTAQPKLVSTVPVDALLDRHDVEFEECKRWANSPEGMKAKMTNPAGFANVRAHAGEHQAILAQAQSGGQKPPSESINFKDLPPDGQVQMAKQAGLDLNPAMLLMKAAMERQDKKDQLKAKTQGKPAKEKAA